MRALKVLSLCVCLVLTNEVIAKEEEFSPYNYGIGAESCGTYLKATPDKRVEYYVWLAGFISRDSWEKMSPIPNMDGNAAQVWIDKYCESHPFHEYAVAVYSMVAELRSRDKAMKNLRIK